jgi:hypothetical protein
MLEEEEEVVKRTEEARRESASFWTENGLDITWHF